MRPLEFVSLARQLGKDDQEVSLRCASSLAYYGAFHFVGERLEQLTADSPNPFRWAGVNKNHGRLREEWRDRFGGMGEFAANFLFLAHELRKRADYDLHLVFTLQDKDETFQFVAQALQAVRQIR